MSDLAQDGDIKHLDEKIDRFLKFVQISRFVFYPILVGIVAVIIQGIVINMRVTQTYSMVVLHDQYRRQRDQMRLQIHHQADSNKSCVSCKMHDDLPLPDLKIPGFIIEQQGVGIQRR